jgi:hypothetical protein
LLWWRNIETGTDTSRSLILNSRLINDDSPEVTFRQAEKYFGSLKDKRIALLGVAYRFNSEDTRNSPTLALANYLREQGISYIMHDPYVKEDDQNLEKFNQQGKYTRNLDEALKDADFVFMCNSHKEYIDKMEQVVSSSSRLKGVVDACNIYQASWFASKGISYTGIGRGKEAPTEEFIRFVLESFRIMEAGLARELSGLIDFYNANYAFDDYNKVKFVDVQRLAKTCSTGCEIADPVVINSAPEYNGFIPKLVKLTL